MNRLFRRVLADVTDIAGVSSETSWWLAVNEEIYIAAADSSRDYRSSRPGLMDT